LEELPYQHSEKQPERSRRCFLKVATAGVAGAIANTMFGDEKKQKTQKIEKILTPADILLLKFLTKELESAEEKLAPLQKNLNKRLEDIRKQTADYKTESQPIDDSIDKLMKKHLSKEDLKIHENLDSSLQRIIVTIKFKSKRGDTFMLNTDLKESLLEKVKTIEGNIPPKERLKIQALRKKRTNVIKSREKRFNKSQEAATEAWIQLDDLEKKINKIKNEMNIIMYSELV